jgi:hypothetical protein
LTAASGAAALVAAVAVALVQHPEPIAGHPGRSAVHVPRRPASAAELVAYATRVAEAAPAFNPQPHQWAYFKRLTAASSAGDAGELQGRPNRVVTNQMWLRVDGHQLAFLRHGKLVIEQASGRQPGGARYSIRWMGALGGFPDSSYKYLDSLPADPAKLRAIIAAGLKTENFVVGSGSVATFNAISDLMQNRVLPPRLRAALYGVLAALPGVRFDRSVTDLAGRHGLGLYTFQEGYLKQEIVINPKTYAYMGDQSVAVRAHTIVAADGTVRVRKGQVLGWNAVLSSGIMQRAGQTP